MMSLLLLCVLLQSIPGRSISMKNKGDTIWLLRNLHKEENKYIFLASNDFKNNLSILSLNKVYLIPHSIISLQNLNVWDYA